MSIINTLNNREIAIGIWLLIALVWALSKATIRSSLYQVLKALFAKKIIIPLLFILVYTLLMVTVFERVGFWDPSATKDTVYWFFGVAFIMFMNTNKVAADEKYFRNIVIDNFKLIVILQFVVNL